MSLAQTYMFAIAREFLEAVTGELDPHTKQKGEINQGFNSVSLLTPAHIQFAKYGRGPGKKPPLEPLLAWVKSNRLQGRDKKGRFTSYLGSAIAMQKSIAKKGTKDWTPNAPNALEEAISKNYVEYQVKMTNVVGISINDEMNKTYKKFVPETMKFKLSLLHKQGK